MVGQVSGRMLDGIIKKALCLLCPHCVMVSLSLGLCSFGFVFHTYVPPSPRVWPYGLPSCVETHTHKQTVRPHTRCTVGQMYPETKILHSQLLLMCCFLDDVSFCIFHLKSRFSRVCTSCHEPQMTPIYTVGCISSERSLPILSVFHISSIDLLIVKNYTLV